MKPLALAASIAALVFCASVVSAQTPAPATPGSQLPTQGMGPQKLQRMQGNMKAMQALMAQIHASNDAKERQSLLQQHMKAMHTQMEMMGGMGGGQMGMMGAGAMPGVRAVHRRATVRQIAG